MPARINTKIAGLIFALVWARLFIEALECSLSIGTRVYLGVVQLPLAYTMRLVLGDWRTYALPILALLLALAPMGFNKLAARLDPRAQRGPRFFLLLCAGWTAALLAVSLLEEASSSSPDNPFTRFQANRFGFYSAFPIKDAVDVRSGNPHVPDYRIETNSLGYRDEEWTPDKPAGASRAVVVGDSYVWGAGIPTKAGMLDTQLEAALNGLDTKEWEVINIAQSPAALWYYANAIMTVGREVRADLYIISFLGEYDLAPWEVQQIKFGEPPLVVWLMHTFGVSRQLMRMGAETGYQYALERKVDPDALNTMEQEFSRLAAFLEETRSRLIVFEALNPRRYLHDFVSDQRAPHGESATFQPGGGTQFIGKSSSRRELGCAPTRTATSRMYS